jgi:hypothetical protein
LFLEFPEQCFSILNHFVFVKNIIEAASLDFRIKGSPNPSLAWELA